jgi:hypothetical protein
MLITMGKIILILISKKSLKIGHQRYWETCKTYKYSQKPAKRQSDRHGCFLKTTGNLILISITEKNFENRTINTKDMEKNVKNIKIA